jgi:hypothetical protein
LVVDMKRREHVRQRDLLLAWHIAALHRQKRLPSRESLLSTSGSKAPQSHEQMESALQMLSRQYGIPIKRMEMGHA